MKHMCLLYLDLLRYKPMNSCRTDWLTEQRTNEWTNERTNEWMNEWMNEWIIGLMSSVPSYKSVTASSTYQLFARQLKLQATMAQHLQLCLSKVWLELKLGFTVFTSIHCEALLMVDATILYRPVSCKYKQTWPMITYYYPIYPYNTI